MIELVLGIAGTSLLLVLIFLVILLIKRINLTNKQVEQIEKNVDSAVLKNFAANNMLQKERFETLEKSVQISQKNLEEKININIANLSASLTHTNTLLHQTVNSVSENLENLRKTLENSLNYIARQNKASIDEMRAVVDEKLSTTLETRLNQSFELINKSLTEVNQGLGDMQTLAKDVGGLKNVLSNVKIRGTWAEFQLDNLLAQMLNTNQYIKNCLINDKTNERVDFAILLPGKNKNEEVLLPIDAKFPIEQYNKLISASQNGDLVGIEKALKELETRVREEAKSISSKYIRVPKTTDFAIMYLPLEGLYAEIVKKDGLYESLQRDYRVMVCGPSTLGAMLTSLQMGFKTVAIEKKSSEIHQLLLVFKREFVKFNELLEKTQKKINEASSTIDDASRKTRTITNKLSKVEEYSSGLIHNNNISMGGEDED